MKRFDCLSLDAPLLGPHLLEASAGTGKTFSIEHIFLRQLLLPVALEEILVVTFTRKATSELKERVRSNLEKAEKILTGQEKNSWPYLEPLLHEPKAIQRVKEALSVFDRAQIFTIHGFCYRMLQEFAFEANVPFSLPDPDQAEDAFVLMEPFLSDFFEKGILEFLCPEQLSLLLSMFDSVEEIGKKLIRSLETEGTPFSEYFVRYQKALELWDAPLPTMADFLTIRSHFKAQIKGPFERQLQFLFQSFSEPSNPLPFQKLIFDRGSLFAFLHPKNRKVKSKEPIHPFFEWIVFHIGPIVEEASDRKKIFSTLVFGWKTWEKKEIAQKAFFLPDEILAQMRKAIEIPSFQERLTRRFQAVIIDEFQDTDALQWEIFQRLFVSSVKSLYLVGDPKQSIYRFRRADVYTYFSAKKTLGEAHLYHLDTNFRSSKELIDSLNRLFSREWLLLPKLEETIPYTPVRAGALIANDNQDGKEAIHWMIGESGASYQETFLPYAVFEIERMNPSSFGSIALLVKDRYEAAFALELLEERGIPAVTRSHQPIGKTEGFRAVRDLLDAIRHPLDESAEKIVALGSFAPLKHSLTDLKEHLEQKGLVSLFTQLGHLPQDPDICQVLEELFAWERRVGFSLEGLERFFSTMEKRSAEEGGRRRMEERDDAVQIMTLHVSKGLEFEIVFALGLISSPPESDEEPEEIDAEKLRQLYVAMTRAKKRLYAPFREGGGSKGSLSPMDLFVKAVEKDEGPFIPFLERLSQSGSLSFERIPTPFSLPLKERKPSPLGEVVKPLPKIPVIPSFMQSFTSLAHPKERIPPPLPIQESVGFSLRTLPRGSETGILIHRIFELLFSGKKAIWKEEVEVIRVVEKTVEHTSLNPWKEAIIEMVERTLSLPFFEKERAFCLKDLEIDQVFAEMEFLYPKGPHFIKGFIDLVFAHKSRFYFLDWKTHCLGLGTEEEMQAVMEQQDYRLQAALYRDALKGALPFDVSFSETFGGAFYVFVRSGKFLFLDP